MILEYLKLAFRDLFANRLRSFLSLIGIIIGVAVVFVIFSIGDITEYAIKEQISGDKGVIVVQYVDENTSSTNSILAQLMAVTGRGGVGEQLQYHFDEADLSAIKDMEGVVDTFPNFRTTVTVDLKSDSTSGTVIRYQENLMEFFTLTLKGGYLMSDYAPDERMGVVIVDTTFVDFNAHLFDPSIEQSFILRNLAHPELYPKVVGETIRINNRIFVIGGVVYSDSGTSSMLIIMDASAYDSMYSKGTMTNLSVKIDPTYDLEEVSERVTGYLNKTHGTDNNYEVQNMDTLISMLTQVTSILSTVMGIIAMVSLVVAGIGVMNIMYVSVVERTREIGVKRAIGASKSAIRFQFIIESCTLTFVGGMLGILVGIGIVQVALYLLDMNAPTNVGYIIFASLFSITLGLAFGYLPARRAANLNIIEAIATE